MESVATTSSIHLCAFHEISLDLTVKLKTHITLFSMINGKFIVIQLTNS